MRISAVLLVLVLNCTGSLAASPDFRAGVARLSVEAATTPFDAIVWYPTAVPETSWNAGPFTIAATRDAPIAEGQQFPLVLLSHGRASDPLSHRELAASLARDGFVVIAPIHVGDAIGYPLAPQQMQIWIDRPRQLLDALETVLQSDRFSAHVDAQRIGMIGFSAGGYTALALAGGRPDFAAAAAYCLSHAQSDAGSCGSAEQGLFVANEASGQIPFEPRIKSLVLMDPAAVMFDAASLSGIGVPVLLYKPDDDLYMGAAANSAKVARGLPSPPEQIVVPGRHFVFIDPCPENIRAEAALFCNDGPGIDRPAIHREMEAQIAEFLHQTLQ